MLQSKDRSRERLAGCPIPWMIWTLMFEAYRHCSSRAAILLGATSCCPSLESKPSLARVPLSGSSAHSSLALSDFSIPRVEHRNLARRIWAAAARCFGPFFVGNLGAWNGSRSSLICASVRHRLCRALTRPSEIHVDQGSRSRCRVR